MVAWRPGKVVTGLVGAGLPADEYPERTCVLLRVVVHDGNLDRFDAQYEATTYPCDLVWGPGSWQEASLWLDDRPHDEDEVDVLDRLFAFQRDRDRLYLPRNPDVAAGLGEEDRRGRWYLIRADFPDDAISHARGVVLGNANQPQDRVTTVLPRALASAPGKRSSILRPVLAGQSPPADRQISRFPRCAACHATSRYQPARL